ncbi:type III pantothenate kinase [Hydrogenovibrio halophilus]|uniref:type III pantothenate kinase n=1 Tax=Hydrogenovibrio halophilus TaxID=373391 RepID=UPI00037E1C95|nr:type III pantothenate kinase [Hydrogenovibrio halophilus]
MKVFFELGNSQLKAAVLVRGEYDYLGRVPNKTVEKATFVSEFDLQNAEVEAVFLSSVASADMNSLFIQQVQAAFGCYPTMLTTQHESAGIECGYHQFEQLGVDRWMAIIGATDGSARPVLIVDAGTALTVDVVEDRVHQGGFIVPGLSLMRQTLFDRTAQVKLASLKQASESQEEDALLARDTENGVLGGTLYMVAAYINQLVNDMESETGRKFDCIGTGGDFPTIQSMLDRHFDYIEDLTLLGMVKVIEAG